MTRDPRLDYLFAVPFPLRFDPTGLCARAARGKRRGVAGKDLSQPRKERAVFFRLRKILPIWGKYLAYITKKIASS
jgi:hypothetical protein